MAITAIGGGTMAAIIGGGAIDAAAIGLGGSFMSSNAASNAADTQANATQNAANIQAQAQQNQLNWLKSIYGTASGQLSPIIDQASGLPSAINNFIGYNPSTKSFSTPSQLQMPMNALAGLTGYNTSTGAFAEPSALSQPISALANYMGYNPATGSFSAPNVTTPDQLQQGYNKLNTNLENTLNNQAAQRGLSGTSALDYIGNMMNQIQGGQLIEGYGAGLNERQSNLNNLGSYISTNSNDYENMLKNLSAYIAGNSGEYQNTLGNLTGLAASELYSPINTLLSQGMNSQVPGVYQNTANNMSTLAQALGSVQAQGQMGQANAWTGAFGSIGNLANNYAQGQQMQNFLMPYQLNAATSNPTSLYSFMQNNPNSQYAADYASNMPMGYWKF